jgi:uncharacterized protein (DUF1800 family)
MAESLPADLSKVDPSEAWKPWTPAAAVPWDRKWVAHLYRRAAFGASPADTKRALADGLPKTLDRLLAGDPGAAELLEMLADAGRSIASGSEAERLPRLRAWWLYAITEGGHPLREKLTLFWHNHFATSVAKVRSTPLMFEQNALLRKHALGKFRPFLLDMSKDAAMLVWLDSNQNVVGAPNENYAREVMELFSLGVGNYTEKDIQEAARAFTGWHVDGVPNSDEVTFQFKPVSHDNGPKTVFGQTGNWDGGDIVRMCCDRPACAKFLVGKLYAFLVSETRPPESLLEPLEARFRKSDYDIADLVRTMLGSRLFFSAHAYRKRVKSPVEYALGAARAVVPGRVPLSGFADPLAKMGQVLFAPPNVKGWRTGTDWLNSATLLARNNFAETVATGNWSGGNQAPSNVKAADVATVPEAAAADVALGEPGVVYPAEGTAAVAGVGVAYTAVPTLTSPDGKQTIVDISKGRAAAGSAPTPGAGGGAAAATAPTGRGTPVPTPPVPAVDAKFDPAAVLFDPKPASVAALVTRMGELLYGEDVPPTAHKKIEKFLLAGKSTLTAKDLDNPAFKQRAREALHALMCLPEYQLA